MKLIEKVGKRTFRYNPEKCIVEYVEKATPDMYADDAEWIEKHGRPLWGIDKDGYIVLDSAGLSRDHWADREARLMYLTEWDWEIGYDAEYLVDEFVKYELPAYQ